MPVIRTTKPGSDWNDADLLILKIETKLQQGTEFFGGEPAPINHLDPNLLLPIDGPIGADMNKETYRFLVNLRFAHYGNINQRGALNELTAMILEVMGYDEYPTMLRRYFDIPFVDCGKTTVSTTDIGLYHCGTGLILLVVRITCAGEVNYMAQVIADAIAAFEYNNSKRVNCGLPRLDEMVIPCITMYGTKPFFYKVPVTQQLSDAVMFGQTPM